MADHDVDPEALIAQLSVEEKVALAAGADLWHTVGVPRLGIPVVKVTDGPSGARGRNFSGGAPAACFPCGTALGATWDVDLVERVGAALAAEVRSKRAHVLLGPTVNLHRHPLAGRNFECYSEDPHLSARMAVAMVRGLQGAGVGACIKHFVANDQEFERMTISSEVGERTLRELYLRPFEAAVHEAGVWSMMSAYNRLNGTYCAEHEWLLTSLLRDEWGWDGYLISDWFGAKSTVPSANAGLDLEMPGPPTWMGDKLAAAVTSGAVVEAMLDEKVRRLLRLAERTGAGTAFGADPSQPEMWDDDPSRRQLLREAAAASIVLLHNHDGALPLVEGSGLTRIAVVGPNAAVARVQGGGSAQVPPPYEVTPLDGLREAFSNMDVEVVYARGCTNGRGAPLLEPSLIGGGCQIDYFGDRSLTGPPVATQRIDQSRVVWLGNIAPGVDPTSWSARLTADYTAGTGGDHGFRVLSLGTKAMRVDGIDVDLGAKQAVPLVAGATYRIEVDVIPAAEAAPISIFELRCRLPEGDDLIADAVAAVSGVGRDAVDAVIVVVGLDADWETEGKDRTTLDLSGRQDELVESIATAHPRTIVVVNAGSPVRMPWVERVAAIVQLWYPGQEGGHALADVVTGSVNPSGRLPTTFPHRIEDTPAFTSYPGERDEVVYGEGVFIGYRWYDARSIAPRFPFGHGLSYTSFSYGPLTIERVDDGSADGWAACVDVTNTGALAGREVVQCYVSDEEASVARPPKELVGFTVVDLAPGATTEARIPFDRRSLSFWDVKAHAWTAEPGRFTVAVGGSSAVLPRQADLVLESTE